MSIKAMSLVWENESLPTTDKMVLLSIADHVGEDFTCYPSISRLCKRTSLKQRAIQGAIKRLVAAGYLTVEMNAGKRGSNLYTVHPTPARNAPPHEMHPAAYAPPPPQEMRPTPAADAEEPSRTVIKPPNSAFSDFWTSWPDKKNKEKARSAFKRLSQKNQDAAVEAIRGGWFARWQAKHPDANPIHASTFLNGKRWEDETPQAVPQASEDEKLDYYAGKINGDGYFAASAIKPDTARDLIRTGRVTPERMRERGIAA